MTRELANGVPSLGQVLRQTQRRALLSAALVVGLLTSLSSAVLLVQQMHRQLDLIARTLAYQVEAAVAFRDRDATRELVADMLRAEGLAQVQVHWAADSVVVQAPTAESAHWQALGQAVARALSLEARATVERNRVTLAYLHVAGDGQTLLWLLVLHLLGAGLAMALTALLLWPGARRVEAQLRGPLEALRAFTEGIGRTRAFDRRLGGTGMAEFDALSRDFNRLLDEVQHHETELMAGQVRLAQANRALRHEATHDALTGLANRAGFMARLAQALSQADRMGTRLAVLFIDADGLKQVNDRWGHEAGDQLLREIARRLRDQLRAADLVARLGGDEYAVLIEPLMGEADVAPRIQAIQQAMQAPFRCANGPELVPRVSVGAAVYPGDARDLDGLLRHADAQMYRAKRARRPNGSGA